MTRQVQLRADDDQIFRLNMPNQQLNKTSNTSSSNTGLKLTLKISEGQVANISSKDYRGTY